MTRDHQLALLNRAAQSLAEVNDIGTALEIHDKAEAIRHYCAVRDRSDGAAVKAAEIKLRAARRVGVLLGPKGAGHGGDRKSEDRIKRRESALEINHRRAAEFRKLAAVPQEQFEAHVAGKVDKGEQPSQAQLLREQKKKDALATLDELGAREAKAALGVYDVLVIDPPWPMRKIVRDCRPNQVEFDYPTMAEAELERLGLPTADDCHVWVWTTHRFLPMAFRLLGTWGLKYVCTFVWHKPGGFQPVGLPQYNCEFALYARKGSPKFADTKAFPVCFDAPRGKHSEKPGGFYDVVRRVTAGRRLDMFNRRPIDGFDGWGNEA